MLPRFHLFEFEDLPWFPRLIRDFMTDYLEFVGNKFKLYRGSLPLFEKGLATLVARGQSPAIVDVCSGGGGAWQSLLPDLKKKHPDLKVTLTDFYPNIAAFEKQRRSSDVIDYSAESVDAKRVPPHLKGLRTQLLSSHHFQPKELSLILANAVAENTPILLLEAQERTIKHLMQFSFSPFFVLLMTPFIKPASLLRFVFTYLVPVVPLAVGFDGIVSVLRTYREDEYWQVINETAGNGKFEWLVGVNRDNGVSNVYLLGCPKNEVS